MKNFLRRDRGRGILDYVVIFLGLALVFWAGCNLDQVPGPELDQQDQEMVLSRDNVQVQIVMAIQERATDDLLSKPGVVGTATGMTEMAGRLSSSWWNPKPCRKRWRCLTRSKRCR